MNFFDLCYELFMRTSKYYDLGKDVENYNKTIYYLNNFNFINRKEIEKFIIEVRFDNPVYSALCQLLKVLSSAPLRLLQELTPMELYFELKGEITNLVFKGAHDCFVLLNNLCEQESANLAKRIASGDMTIFTDYKC